MVAGAYAKGRDSESGKWCHELSKKFRDDIEKWPNLGCGTGFRAFNRGPSLVVEIRVDATKNKWEAFLSERLPTIVDDCLKTHRLELLNRGIKKLSPEEIYECLPVLLPQTHHLSVDGFEMQGIAKYPIDVWIEEKRP